MVGGEKFIDAGTEDRVTLAEGGDFIGGDARAPLEAFADGGLELVEVAGMDAGGFPCLDGGEDLERVCPPVDVDGGGVEAESFEFTDGGAEAGDNFRLAVVEKNVVDDGEMG